MPAPIDEFPPTETLSDMLNGFIELLQSQLQISYPSARLASSNELRQDPSLVTIVKIVLKFVEDYIPLGTAGSLYTRGAADYWPPRLSLQDCYTEIIDFDATERVVDVDIVGEHRMGFIITSPPTLVATLHTSFNLNLADHSTLHNLKLIVPTNPEQEPSRNMQPIKILILNAGGIQNPAFLPVHLYSSITTTTLTLLDTLEDNGSYGTPVSLPAN
ncbi:hypothetical protein COLO4_24951 [Corchorus olitorius]|uniref:Uncharacterized protein n=1 Tax=Corchorus olitorius TaxID=93759 RepID=A0A1R3I5R3_9ROSI|nr:hypothetical protein COLO4_24951 [Corchorus olitorius]